MAYVLGGGNNEADGFTTAIANFAQPIKGRLA